MFPAIKPPSTPQRGKSFPLIMARTALGGVATLIAASCGLPLPPGRFVVGPSRFTIPGAYLENIAEIDSQAFKRIQEFYVVGTPGAFLPLERDIGGNSKPLAWGELYVRMSVSSPNVPPRDFIKSIERARLAVGVESAHPFPAGVEYSLRHRSIHNASGEGVGSIYSFADNSKVFFCNAGSSRITPNCEAFVDAQGCIVHISGKWVGPDNYGDLIDKPLRALAHWKAAADEDAVK